MSVRAAARSRLRCLEMPATICAVAALPLLLFILIDVSIGLEHRSRVWPWIDTVETPGYSEAAFQVIRIGMTRAQVDALMCTPLEVVTDSPDGLGYVPVPVGASLDIGALRYSYTRDGRCPWGDFAWFGREIWFKDGVVRKVVSGVYYD